MPIDARGFVIEFVQDSDYMPELVVAAQVVGLGLQVREGLGLVCCAVDCHSCLKNVSSSRPLSRILNLCVNY